MMTDRRLRSGDFPAGKLVLAWLAVCAILLLTALSRLSVGQFPDPDDVLRLVQVRDLLAGQSWFDPVQYRIDPPQGTPMHWSRLVDLPLYLVIAAFTPLFGQAVAEIIAVIAVPLLTFGIAAAAIGRLAWRLLGARAAIFAVLACGFLPALLFQFQPQRIDHHGWQIASIAVAVWAISWRSATRGGIVAGLAAAFGLSISLEVLPMAGALGGVLFLRWWLDHKQRHWLASYMAALSLGLLAFYLGTRGPSLLEYCDAISPAHIGFFLVAALGTLAIAKITRLRGFGLIVLFGIVGGLALGTFASISPTCLATPFARLDPVVDAYWYRQVLEGQPLFAQGPTAFVPAMIQMLAALGAAFVLRQRSDQWARRWWTEYLLLLLAAVILSLLVARSLAFASILAAVPLGWLASSLLERIRSERAPIAKIAAVLVFILLLAPMTPVTIAGKLAPAGSELAVSQTSVGQSSCLIREEAPKLAALPESTIFAPLDVGPTILLKTDHAVVATGHHRAEAAMADVIKAFTASPDDARAIVAAHDADYIALCANLAEAGLYAHEAPDGLMARIRDGNPPPWLEPVAIGAAEQFRVYRVRE